MNFATSDFLPKARHGDCVVPANEPLFFDTTAGPLSVRLPKSPKKGDMIVVIDWKESFSENPLTLMGNGNLVFGSSELTLDSGPITLLFDPEALADEGEWRIIPNVPGIVGETDRLDDEEEVARAVSRNFNNSRFIED